MPVLKDKTTIMDMEAIRRALTRIALLCKFLFKLAYG